MEIDPAPIFFIGVPRSGTTVLFEAFARHENLGWPSNYSREFPGIPQFGLILRLTNNRLINLSGQKKQYSHVLKINKILPKPAEAYKFWNHYTEIDFSKQYLIDISSTPRSKKRMISAVKTLLFWEGKTRFSAKLTGPSRIHFIKSIFPKAKFVHVVRDGRAVVHSMLNSSGWSSPDFLKQPWWKGGLTDKDLREWHSSNNSPAILAALQWRRIIEVAQDESIQCHNENYMEIKYEHFIDRPYETIKQLYAWSGLEVSNLALDYINDITLLPDMNQKYKKDMTQDEINLLTGIMESQLTRLAYI